ncbi:hypothetical protein D9M71_776730 [compost metagenome]
MAGGQASELRTMAGAKPRVIGLAANGLQGQPGVHTGQKWTLTRKLMVFWSVVKASLSLMPYLFFQ